MSGQPQISLHFGKNIGEVKLNQDRGVQKSAFDNKDKNLSSIFGKYDKDRNNILDETELANLYKDIQDAAGDKNLSKDEALNFLKACGIDVDKDEARNIIQKFLNTIGGDTDLIKSAVKDENGNVTVEYSSTAHRAGKGIFDNEVRIYAYDAESGTSKLTERSYNIEDGTVNINYTEEGKTETRSRGYSKEELPAIVYDAIRELHQDCIPENTTTIKRHYKNDQLEKIVLLDNRGIAICELSPEFNENGEITAWTQIPVGEYAKDSANVIRIVQELEDGAITGYDMIVTPYEKYKNDSE